MWNVGERLEQCKGFYTTENTERHRGQEFLNLSSVTLCVLCGENRFVPCFKPPPGLLRIGNALFTKPSSLEVSSFTLSSPKGAA